MKEGDATILSVTVTNNANHDITLPGRVVLARLKLVQSVTPLELRFKDPETPSHARDRSVNNIHLLNGLRVTPWLPEVDLSALTVNNRIRQDSCWLKKQTHSQRAMMTLAAFQNWKWTGDQSVEKNYISIPRPLYPDVKGYIADLLDRGFIRKYKSPFSSSVVCVYKKRVE